MPSRTRDINPWFIACTPFTSPSARELARRLGLKCGSKPKSVRTKIIRWGNLDDFAHRHEQFQTAESIRNCSNKLLSLDMMHRAGVRVGNIYRRRNEIPQNVQFPLYSRKIRHTKGTDIIICNTLEEARRNIERDGRYLVQGIPCKKEYRVHVFNGEIISASKKYFGQELWERLGRPEKKDLVRNNETGWRYYDIQDMENVPTDVKEHAKLAVSSLGLLWGAVDIIYTPNKEAYVLEVNSAPGLRDSRADLYADKLRAFMQNQTQTR